MGSLPSKKIGQREREREKKKQYNYSNEGRDEREREKEKERAKEEESQQINNTEKVGRKQMGKINDGGKQRTD